MQELALGGLRLGCKRQLRQIAQEFNETGRYRFEDIRKAHRVMEANEADGKMVVLV
jgi:hypothetical protein